MLLLALPFAYARRKNRLRNQKLLEGLDALAMQHALTLSGYDFWNPGYAIGIDGQQKQLLYTRKQEGREVQTLVDLLDVQDCRISKETRETNGNLVIERIALIFSLRGPKHPEVALEFYNMAVNLNHTTELQLAGKWKGIVDSCLAAAPLAR